MKANDFFVFCYLQISFFTNMCVIIPPFPLLLSFCCGSMYCPDPEVGRVECLCVHKCVELI